MKRARPRPWLWLSAIAAAGISLSAGAAPSVENGSKSYVIGCGILSERGELLKYLPGKMCVFLPDGSFVSYLEGQESTLSYFGARGELLWSKPLRLHHQLKISSNGRSLITLSWEKHPNDLCDVEYQAFLEIDLKSGAIVHRWSSYEHFRELLDLTGRLFLKTPEGYPKCNFTHFNSIDEIPENPTAAKQSAFAKGGFIVGLYGLPTFGILDSKMEKLIWTAPLSDEYAEFHDLQVLPSGRILIYFNAVTSFPDNAVARKGSIRIFDPISGKTEWEYPGTEGKAFPVGTDVMGGAQYLDDGILFNTNGEIGGWAYKIGHDKHKLWSWPLPFKDQKGRPFSFQDIKVMDLRDFLKNNR